MAEKLPVILLLLASHLFVSGVLSGTILTIENKCNQTVWPVIYSYQSQLSTTGFDLRSGEARALQAPSSWNGLISGRTYCSTDSTGKFLCATGDCESGKVECPGTYGWSKVTYVLFKINYGGINSYSLILDFGYNLPITVTTSESSKKCISSGCMVDLNKICPDNLKLYNGVHDQPIACSSACQASITDENCCLGYYKSRKTCKLTDYMLNFDGACPLAISYPHSDNNSTITCTNSTNFVITFCPFSIPNITSSTAPLVRGKQSYVKKLTIPILGGLVALFTIVSIAAITLIVREKNTRREKNSNDENIEAAVMLKRYSYEKVKKMTNMFAHVLGKGGYGTVYKGKLPDASGRDIAVKILDRTTSKGNREDFINEIASMSRASHINIVSLFGFCYEGSNRAIIYELMPNGSLDRFISKNMSSKKDWKLLFNIAVGISRGLEYLHNNCVSKIVHFDIKPQNILINEDFSPKISDFGLSKLCKYKESVISLLDMRGTIGYIAPEVFSKSYGGVSHKSDVYSYGMVVLEMIGLTNKGIIEGSRSNTGSVFFPDFIYEDLKKNEALRHSGDDITKEEEEEEKEEGEEEEEEKIKKKMTIVGLWCIQTNPAERPPIKKIVEMLEGSLESLEVPPKPLLNSHVWDIAEDIPETSSALIG